MWNHLPTSAMAASADLAIGAVALVAPPSDDRRAPSMAGTIEFDAMPAEFADMATWALGLFDEAGLALPPMRFEHHGDDTTARWDGVALTAAWTVAASSTSARATRGRRRLHWCSTKWHMRGRRSTSAINARRTSRRSAAGPSGATRRRGVARRRRRAGGRSHGLGSDRSPWRSSPSTTSSCDDDAGLLGCSPDRRLHGFRDVC